MLRHDMWTVRYTGKLVCLPLCKEEAPGIRRVLICALPIFLFEGHI